MADETARERHLAREERQRADRERNQADRERHRADQERYRADQERHRATEGRERQAEVAERQDAALDLLRRSALLSARFQLDTSDINRGRWQFFLSLMQRPDPPGEDQG
ncbi:MAG: hypothetical protein FJ083_03120 [Cyanobacteria bacterium K_Offshore_surface_m2_239]|nr:hypothetical protein [Cyanobacteria bacterium K_Offshore_surface_m2_239]